MMVFHQVHWELTCIADYLSADTVTDVGLLEQDITAAVSYTHLDVYKRQLMNIIGCMDTLDTGHYTLDGVSVCLLYTSSRCKLSLPVKNRRGIMGRT